jgi:serine/threonine-protein kinase
MAGPGDSSADETRMDPSRGHHVQNTTSGSGWLSSSGSVDHGRFAPGAMLDNRYRVLGLLGRGGMGEVYRADDLRLGQQVALKFLPEALAIDARRLAQFHNEVRTARQVSHPNVCRVYDIGEVTIAGQSLMFLTMEYVDGEDLSVLLRRIGRLPEERAIEIARQICAGLAAAHERGILHRDLKPANIMLDGSGRVRIMDFSLAAIGAVDDVRAGTPAYMAPEQLAGLEVTVRSDIYALGLVLYEVFTGRRAFDAKTVADLVAQHQSGSITSPIQLVSSLDDAVDRAIMRCLESEPARRPSSALAVAASMPGGDPLAAALAAGETPSPEMVAAAGAQGATLSLQAGVMWLAVFAALTFVCIRAADRFSLLARIPLTKSTEVLVDRASELRQSLGYATSIDEAHGYLFDNSYLSWAAKASAAPERWSSLPTGRPAAFRFWYRSSPRILIPVNRGGSPTLTDPAPNINGMVGMSFDTTGRLLRFEAAPPQQESPAPPAPLLVDWDPLFAAAAVNRADFAEAVPTRTPATFADERRAWTGKLPGTAIPISIEAAGYRGRPVLFEFVTPWTVAARDITLNEPASSNNPYFIALLLIGAAIAARANVKSGRADRKGGFRLAAFVFSYTVLQWLLDRHVMDASVEELRAFNVIGVALFLGVVLDLVYLGLEPFLRRSRPTVLVGWSRVLSGQLRDPLVGRDLVIGAACGAALGVLNLLPFMIPSWRGLPDLAPFLTEPHALMGARPFLLASSGAVNNALQNALITVFEYMVYRTILVWLWNALSRRLSGRVAWFRSPRQIPEWLIAAGPILFVTADALAGSGTASALINAALAGVTLTLTLAVLLRAGLFASCIMLFVSNCLDNLPMTFDTTKPYAPASWTTLAIIAGLAALGFWMARSGDQISQRLQRVRHT